MYVHSLPIYDLPTYSPIGTPSTQHGPNPPSTIGIPTHTRPTAAVSPPASPAYVSVAVDS